MIECEGMKDDETPCAREAVHNITAVVFGQERQLFLCHDCVPKYVEEEDDL